MPLSDREPYLLPYQARWVQDDARFKIVEKSRRIGLSYGQSYEDTRYAAQREGSDVWFSSADESAAVEYIRYCATWAKIFGIAAEDLGEIVLVKKDDIKARSIEFASGHRIYGLSSNPKGFRSKGGKLVLDEFAFHPDQDAMWKAAQPIVTWGFPVRVISTYNGKGNRYHRMVGEARKPGSIWSLHTITILDAVADGLADRILGRELTDEERAAWVEELRQSASDEDTWQQEYLCNPSDTAAAWLSWELITAVEDPGAGVPSAFEGGPAFLGWDVARRRDGSVMRVLEKVGDVYWTRERVQLTGKKFSEQLAVMDQLMDRYKIRRACIDQTGMGEPIVEEAQRRHGEYRVEGVQFTAPVKQDLAVTAKQIFEDKRIRIEIDRDTRDQLHAVRKEITAAGNVRFDAARTEAGHADEFWALALALHAAGDGSIAPAAAEVAAERDGFLLPAREERVEGGQFGKWTERLRGALSARRRPWL